MSIEKFKELVIYFGTILKEENKKRIENDKNRQRKAGGGSKATLDSSEAKLFYIKVYPTFDVAGFIFDTNRSQTNRWMHQLLPILERVLDRRVVLPKRKIDNVEAFIKSFPKVK